jgi:hypothetical protein
MFIETRTLLKLMGPFMGDKRYISLRWSEECSGVPINISPLRGFSALARFRFQLFNPIFGIANVGSIFEHDSINSI